MFSGQDSGETFAFYDCGIMLKEVSIRSINTNSAHLIDGSVKDIGIGQKGTYVNDEATHMKEEMSRELFDVFSKKSDQNISGGWRELFNGVLENMMRTIGDNVESIVN